MDGLLEKLKSSKNHAIDKIEDIRFRGEEEGRFKYKWNNYNRYFGRIIREGHFKHRTEKKITSTSTDLLYAIAYALQDNKVRCLELNGRPIVDSRIGFPLVMAINIHPYFIYPGLEVSEDIICGEINKEDVFVLFDSKTNHFKELLEEYHTALKHLLTRQNKAREEELEFQKAII